MLQLIPRKQKKTPTKNKIYVEAVKLVVSGSVLEHYPKARIKPDAQVLQDL